MRCAARWVRAWTHRSRSPPTAGRRTLKARTSNDKRPARRGVRLRAGARYCRSRTGSDGGFAVGDLALADGLRGLGADGLAAVLRLQRGSNAGAGGLELVVLD